MKRILITMAAVGALAGGSAALLAGSAGAANPHGDKGDPSASCGQGSKSCDDQGLPQSNGCNANSSAHNPHCTTGLTPVTPTTPTTPAAPVTPVTNQPANPPANPGGTAGKNAQGVAGKEANGTAPAATASNPAETIDQLPFTGLETLWLALFGAGLLGLGLLLRVRLSSPETDADSTPSAPRLRSEGASLSLSEFGTLGLMLIESGHARLQVGPGGGAVAFLE